MRRRRFRSFGRRRGGYRRGRFSLRRGRRVRGLRSVPRRIGFRL